MVYPLVALFFGTGNQTPKVSAAIIARVFRDPSLALFEYDPESLLSQTPPGVWRARRPSCEEEAV